MIFRPALSYTLLAMVCIASGASVARASASRPPGAFQKSATGDPMAQCEMDYHLEIVDAQAFEPTMQGALKYPGSATLGSVFLGAYRRFGVVADGASVLVLRFICPRSSGSPSIVATPDCPVTFTISDPMGDPAPVIGSISAAWPSIPAPLGGAAGAGGKAPQTSVTIPAGRPAFVYYCPPDHWKDFTPSSPLSPQGAAPGAPLTTGAGPLQAGPVTITVTYPQFGTQVTAGTLNLSLCRPPIVLVHGFLSGPAVWNPLVTQFEKEGIPSGEFHRVDYSGSNTSGYAANGSVVGLEIQKVVSEVDGFVPLTPYQNKPAVAATRLDVIAHSMGGCLAIWYASDLGKVTITRGDGFPNATWDDTYRYRRANDFGLGDIHRFISIGSPFDGSPWASAAVSNNSMLQLIKYYANIPGITGDYDAIFDMQPSSSATKMIESANVGVYWLPVAGLAQSAPGSGILSDPWADLFSFINQTPLADGLTTQNSDLVVLETSALDAAGTAPAKTKDFVIQGLVHTAEPASTTFWSDIDTALDFTFTGGSASFNGAF